MSGSGSRRVLGGALAVGFTTLVLVGCAPTASTPSANSDAAALVERRCTVCHTLDRVTEAKKDEAGWNSTVDRMRNNGAVVSEAEQKVIVTYLTAQ